MKHLLTYLACFASLLLSVSQAKELIKANTDTIAAIDSLFTTLNDTQRKAVQFSFDDDDQRKRWSNLPTGIFARKGLRMGDMNKEQKEAIFNVLQVALSKRGFKQVIDNMHSDELLKNKGVNRRNLIFGEDEYYFSILGTPSLTTPWMWQFGGHHLAFNATFFKDQITLSPTMTGGQPIDFEKDGEQVRQLGGDEDLSFSLINALNPEQLKQAQLGTHFVHSLISGPKATDITPKKEGICAADLNQEQKDLLLKLIQERIGILNDLHTEVAMEKIQQQLDQTYFSWYGHTEKDSAASYRIQGPSVIIEYSPQHVGGDPNNHTHAMYRDPSNDYGSAFVK